MTKKITGLSGRTRSIYNGLKKHPGVLTTQSYLRLETNLGTQSTINFNVLNNQGAQTVTEKRLSITDSFIVTGLSIFTYLSNGTNGAKSTLDTFPNPLVYTGAGDAATLQEVYNGFLSIRVNSVVYIDSLDVYRFYRVGQAQKAVLLTNVPSEYQQSTWDGGDYGFYSLTPSIELSGATKNEIQLTLPENISTTSKDIFAVCYLRGFLRQNNAQFNPRS